MQPFWNWAVGQFPRYAVGGLRSILARSASDYPVTPIVKSGNPNPTASVGFRYVFLLKTNSQRNAGFPFHRSTYLSIYFGASSRPRCHAFENLPAALFRACSSPISACGRCRRTTDFAWPSGFLRMYPMSISGTQCQQTFNGAGFPRYIRITSGRPAECSANYAMQIFHLHPDLQSARFRIPTFLIYG